MVKVKICTLELNFLRAPLTPLKKLIKNPKYLKQFLHERPPLIPDIAEIATLTCLEYVISQVLKGWNSYRYVGEITSFRTKKKPVLIEASRYVDYSGSPALRRAATTRSMSASFLKGNRFALASMLNLGLMSKTFFAAALASASRPIEL